MRNFFRLNKFALIVFFGLLILPFFWFGPGKVDYGGDSNRLYFYDPFSWLKNIALYITNPLTSLGQDIPNFMMIPFLLFLTLLKNLIFHSGYSLNNFFNGLLLSGSFISIYFIVVEILKQQKEEDKNIYFPAAISGLFFSLSPILLLQWERSLYSIAGVFVYPLFFLLFLKYLHTNRIHYLIISAIVCFVFSVNFSFATSPWLFAFFPFGFTFLFFYSLLYKNLKSYFKGLLILLVLLVLVLSFDYVVQAYGMINPFGLNSKMLSGSGRALSYFLSIQPYMRLIYNILNQDQYVISSGFSNPFVKIIFNFGIKYLPVFSLYPLTIFFGTVLVRKNKSLLTQKLMVLILFFFLILLYFMTANLTGLGVLLYKMLFQLPFFSMFRSYNSKFGMVFVFFYAILLGFSLSIVFTEIKSFKKRRILSCIFLILIIFNGWPLISGKMSSGTLWRSKNIPYANEIDPLYQEFIDRLKQEKQSFKVMSFPFANEDYQVLQGRTGGVYFGPSSIPILTGKNAFSGQSGFSVFWPFLQSFIKQGNFNEAKRLLSLLNIGYIFYNSDEYIYQNFPNYPYSDWLKQNYTNEAALKKLVDDFVFEKIYNLKTYNLLKLQNQYLLPLIYVPKKITISNDGPEIIPGAINIGSTNPRPLYYLENLNNGVSKGNFKKEEADMVIVDGKSRDIENLETIERITGSGSFFVSVKESNIVNLLLKVLSEKYKEIELGDDKYSIFTERLTTANKKLNEAVSYRKNVGLLYEFYKKNISKALDTIKNEKNSKSQLEYVLILKNNLADGLARLEKSKPDNFEKWETTIKEALPQIINYIPEFSVKKRTYSFNVPRADRYKLIMDGLSPSLTKSMTDLLDGCEIEIFSDKSQSKKLILVPREENSVINFGDIDLSEGEYQVNLDFCKLENQINQNDWETSLTKGYKLPAAKVIYSKKIANWNPDLWYEISGKAYGNSKLKIAIGEERKRWVVSHSKVKLLDKSDIVRTEAVGIDSGVNEFKFYLRSSEFSSSADIFFYYEDSELKKNEEPFLQIERVNVVPVFNPLVMLVAEDLSKEELVKNTPKITFTKVNPARFNIKVEEATGPYYLVFSDSFHPGWQIYYLGNETQEKIKLFKIVDRLLTFASKEIFKSDYLRKEEMTVGSYFNGEVKEQEPKEIFWEASSHNTWEKQPAIKETNHFVANGYSNAWYITPNDVGGETSHNLVLEFKPQRFFYIGLFISFCSLGFCLILLVFLLVKSVLFHAREN